MKKFLCAAATMASILIAGCTTATHIATGATRPPLKPDQVTIYQVAPAKFEIVGLVNAASAGRMQRHMDDAVKALKKQAAKIGANGILLGVGGVNPGSEAVGVGVGSAFSGPHSFYGSSVTTSSSGIQLAGQAIYVAP